MAKARRGRRRPSAASRPSEGAGREHWRSDGQPKTRFATQEEANRASLRLRLEESADLDPYECGYCHGWHLGTRRK
ncbi:MAG: hypothetical protein ACRDWB_13725 [Acidimicrobiales bacterium]